MQIFVGENVKEKNRLEYRGIDGRIILKWTFND
jgi:hypothetical protein